MTVQTDRLNTALAGRYRIERHLGEGGMATVYLCDDLKHDRKVALKLLKPELAAVLGAERFVQEIKTTAALQHPHILPLFDSGAADGFLFYVMPFIDGETLRAKLDRETQLGVDDAVRIAREVADALHYAHTRGIVHRDVKPENILLHGGHAMVADFGIALAVSAAAGGRMTETGLSLGTPHYMSPEQATAEKEITARSDVYSLGSVLYEMLTGNPPYTGANAQQIIMKIITEPAEAVTKYRKSVPPNVAAAVAKSLEKLPADRFDSAKAFADALNNPNYSFAGGATGARAWGMERAASWNRATIGMAAVVALFAISTVALWRSRAQPLAAPPSGVVRFPLVTTDSLRLNALTTTPFAITPDGRTIAFPAQGADGKRSLWVRTLEDPRPRRLDNTFDGSNPAFSPDGESIAFIIGNNTIRRMQLSGGSATTVTTVDGGTASLAWLTADTILFETLRGAATGIRRIGANGGAPATLIPIDTAAGELTQRRPFVLRRERLVLFASTDTAGIDLVAYSLADGRRRRLGVAGVQALGFVDGHLVYSRTDGTLMAVAFDPSTMRTSGMPRELREHVYTWNGGTNVMFSEGGTMVYRPAEQQGATLMLVDTLGRSRPLSTEVRAFLHPRFSPNGQQVVVAARSNLGEVGVQAMTDLWLIDRSTGEGTRLTSTGTASSPEWMPDGRRIAWLARTATRRNELWVLALDRSAEPRPLYDVKDNLVDAAFTRDGKSFVGLTTAAGGWRELARYSLDEVPSAPRTVSRAPGRNGPSAPRISPDGRWVLIADIGQVYVRPVDGASAIEVITEGAGYSPAWGPDSRSIYYNTGDGWMVAELQVTPTLSVVRRRRVGTSTMHSVDFDLSPDGKTFVAVQSNSSANVLVVTGWSDEVRRVLRGKE